jgi:enoyl-CoA hydratase/carnithine racemase
MHSSYPYLRVEAQGPVATVTLCQPERRNAMTPAAFRALAAVPEGLPPEVRVVVIRGEGASFCAGLDLRMAGEGVPGEPTMAELLSGSRADTERLVGSFQQGFTWLRDPRFITIAVVQGHAVGGGFQLALAADFRLLHTDAHLCMREVALGSIPDLTGTAPLVRLVGYSRALEICVSARRIPAPEALALGLATRVVAPEQVEDALAELVAGALGPPAHAVRAVKAALLDASARTLVEQAEVERRIQAPVIRGEAERQGLIFGSDGSVAR